MRALRWEVGRNWAVMNLFCDVERLCIYIPFFFHCLLSGELFPSGFRNCWSATAETGMWRETCRHHVVSQTGSNVFFERSHCALSNDFEMSGFLVSSIVSLSFSLSFSSEEEAWLLWHSRCECCLCHRWLSTRLHHDITVSQHIKTRNLKQFRHAYKCVVLFCESAKSWSKLQRLASVLIRWGKMLTSSPNSLQIVLKCLFADRRRRSTFLWTVNTLGRAVATCNSTVRQNISTFFDQRHSLHCDMQATLSCWWPSRWLQIRFFRPTSFAGDLQYSKAISIGVAVFLCSDVCANVLDAQETDRSSPLKHRSANIFLMRDHEWMFCLLRVYGNVSLRSSSLPARRWTLAKFILILNDPVTRVLHYFIWVYHSFHWPCATKRCSFSTVEFMCSRFETVSLWSRCSSRHEAQSMRHVPWTPPIHLDWLIDWLTLDLTFSIRFAEHERANVRDKSKWTDLSHPIETKPTQPTSPPPLRVGDFSTKRALFRDLQIQVFTPKLNF